MTGETWEKVDAALTVASDLRAELSGVRALFMARVRTTVDPGNVRALDLTNLEAEGLGLVLGLLVDQLERLETDLKAAAAGLSCEQAG